MLQLHAFRCHVQHEAEPHNILTLEIDIVGSFKSFNMHRIFTMSRWLNRVDIWYIRMKGYKPYTKPSTWAGTNTIFKPVSSFHTTSLYSYYKKLAKNWITSQGNYFLFTAPSNTAPSILRHAVIHHLVCTLLAPFLPCRVQQFLNILCIVLMVLSKYY